MEIVTGIFIAIAAGTIGFCFGIRICGWRKQSIAEEYNRLLKDQADAWIARNQHVKDLHRDFINAALDSNDITDKKCLALRHELAHALSSHIPIDD